jgi:hypothetical protein
MRNKSFAGQKSTVAQTLLLALAIFLSAVNAHAGEKVVFQFNQNQGFNPSNGLISDSAGDFYGTASGGIGICSNVYELSPGSNGTYTETVLYTFQNCNRTGLYPTGALSIDKNGNLYGAEYGFSTADGSGLVYELTKQTEHSPIVCCTTSAPRKAVPLATLPGTAPAICTAPPLMTRPLLTAKYLK